MGSPGLMHKTGCSGLVQWDDSEGWDGEGGGKGLQDGEHMYTRGGFMSMYGKTNKYCKVTSLQSKKKIMSELDGTLKITSFDTHVP